MDPEQWLFVILEHFAVEFLILFFRAFIWMFRPKRFRIADGNRTFQNLRFLNRFFLLRVFALFFLFWLFHDLLDNCIFFSYFFTWNRLVLRFCIFVGKENLNRHKGTVFIQHFTHAVFIGELITVFVQMKNDLRSDRVFVAVAHLKFGSALRLPVNGLLALQIRTSIDLHAVSYHKGRIETKSEMSDDLVFT